MRVRLWPGGGQPVTSAVCALSSTTPIMTSVSPLHTATRLCILRRSSVLPRRRAARLREARRGGSPICRSVLSVLR